MRHQIIDNHKELMEDLSEEYILIVDFGSQVTQLIARRFRELNIYCEIKPYQKINFNLLKKHKPKGIILSGGPSSVTLKNFPKIPFRVFELKIPIFAICYGQQLMAKLLDGNVTNTKTSAEFGKSFIFKKNNSPIISGLFKKKRNKFGCHMATLFLNFLRVLKLLPVQTALQTQ